METEQSNISPSNNIKINTIPKTENKSEIKIIKNEKIEIKESAIHLEIDEKKQKDKKKPEKKDINETNTVSTTIGFLNETALNQENLTQINKIDTQSNSSKSTSNSESKSDKQNKETFMNKTKRWAGNILNKMNIKNYFPKQEFTEYKNANGIIMKIPKKKLPLKKKKNSNNLISKLRNNNEVKENRDIIINYANSNSIFGGYL